MSHMTSAFTGPYALVIMHIPSQDIALISLKLLLHISFKQGALLTIFWSEQPTTSLNINS